MVECGQSVNEAPVEVAYAPQLRDRRLPVEVVGRAELVARISGRELASRQRATFHQLVVCTGGSGRHEVDYQPVELSPGALLRIYPGQVQQFVPESDFEADVVVWPVESHHTDPIAPTWYPGNGVPICWWPGDELFSRVMGTVDELKVEQDRFDGSARYISLMKAILCTFLIRLSIEIPESVPDATRLPQPYVEFRELIEESIYRRATVGDLARDLGYSTRTLDRACHQATGRTARQILDDRVAFEARRLLTHSTRPIVQIGTELGFSDPSNFSKFVKRHLGQLPGAVRGRPGDR